MPVLDEHRFDYRGPVEVAHDDRHALDAGAGGGGESAVTGHDQVDALVVGGEDEQRL